MNVEPDAGRCEAAGAAGVRLPDFVALHARARPSHPALIDAELGRRLDYAALDRAVSVAGAALRERGVERGSRVAVLSRNRIELIVLHLACARVGAILVPLNWRLSPAELQTILADCAPSLLIHDGVADAVVPPDGRHVELDALLPTLGQAPDLPASASASASASAGGGEPSLMLYTSGTSGRPKGVPLTERNLHATAVNFTILGQVTPASVFLADAPMFHVIGLVTNVRPALMMGGTIIVSGGFDPAVTLARLSDPGLGVSHYFCVPQMAEMLRSSPAFEPARLRRLTAIFTGGAPHPASSIRQWLDDDITIVDGYGMTEAGTVLGMPLERGVIEGKAGSAGLMPPTMEYRIVSEDGRPCARGEVGELLLRGENVTSGYWNMREETEKAFTEDGFFRTGDLVRIDEDGFFYLVGRKKDMFISGGENVYPAEIEAVLKSCREVTEACVVGVADPRWGEVGHAFVVLRPGAQLDEMSILEYCAARLARYKIPKRVTALAELPRTGSGKVSKAELLRRVTR